MSETASIIPVVPDGEGGARTATALTFDERQDWLAGLEEGERDAMFKLLPDEVRLQWSREELEHLQELVKDQPADGAEFGEDPGEEVKIPGAKKPVDRAPDVGEALIEELVGKQVAAETKAARLQIELDAANAEVQAYYEAFGPLRKS